MRLRVFSVAVVAWFGLATTAFAQGTACDRASLLGIADAYFAALVAHDPSKAPMAPNATFTEQTREMKGRRRTVDDHDGRADGIQGPCPRSGLRTGRSGDNRSG